MLELQRTSRPWTSKCGSLLIPDIEGKNVLKSQHRHTCLDPLAPSCNWIETNLTALRWWLSRFIMRSSVYSPRPMLVALWRYSFEVVLMCSAGSVASDVFYFSAFNYYRLQEGLSNSSISKDRNLAFAASGARGSLVRPTETHAGASAIYGSACMVCGLKFCAREINSTVLFKKESSVGHDIHVFDRFRLATTDRQGWREPVAMLCFAHLSTSIIKQWHCKEPAHHVQDVQSWIRIVVTSMGGAFILQDVTKLHYVVCNPHDFCSVFKF